MTVPEIRIIERTEPDKSTHWIFTQGNIELEVFSDDLVRSIEAIDKLPVGRWTEFAIQNELPCDPVDRKILKPPLSGIIQLAWHAQFTGSVSDRLKQNQERRIATYLHDLEHVKLTTATPADRKARATRAPHDESGKFNKTGKVHYGSRFRLRMETAEEWSAFLGQKAVIIAIMVAGKAVGTESQGITKDEVAEYLRGKLNTRQPEERVVGFYFGEWQKSGIVERIEPTTEVPKPEIPVGWETGIQTRDSINEIRQEVNGGGAPEAPPPAAKTKGVKANVPETDPKPPKKAAAKKPANK